MKILRYLLLVFVCITPVLNAGALAKYKRGLIQYEKGNTSGLKKAVNFFKKALEDNPYFFRALRHLGITYVKLEHYNLARKFLQKALYQQPDNIETNLYMARTLMKLGLKNKAKPYIDKVLTAKPRNAEALYTDALYHISNKRSDIAIRRLNTVKKILPGYFWTYIKLGQIYYTGKYYNLAEANFRNAIHYNSISKWPHYHMGRYFYLRGRNGSAYPFLQKALYIDSEFKDALILYGRVLFYRKQWKDAEQNYISLIKMFPYKSIYRYTLALVYIKLAEKDSSYIQSAVDNFKAALKMQNNDEVVRYRFEEFLIKKVPIRSAVRKSMSAHHYQRGNFYSGRNLFFRAQVAYKRAIRIYPVSTSARGGLADVYRILKYWDLYYRELKVIKLLKRNDTRLEDKIAFFKKLVKRLPSYKARIDQYKQNSVTPSVVVFNLFDLYNRRHNYFGIQNVYGAIIRDAIFPNYRYRLKRLKDHSVSSLIDARIAARKAGADYFIHGRYIKGQNFTKIEIYLRTTRTGAVIKRYTASRRGNNRLFEVAVSLSKKILADIPVFGQIIRMRGDRAVINIGKLHGIKKGMTLIVVPGAGFRQQYLSGLGKNKPAKISGKIKIIKVDESLAVAEIVNRNNFDSIALYQYVILKPEKRKNR